MNKTIGNWHLSCGMGEAYIEARGEDGPYTKRVSYPSIEARSEHGKLYQCIIAFETLEEAQAYLGALCAPFDPEKHDDFRFDRNV
jgi:hypothetical protein